MIVSMVHRYFFGVRLLSSLSHFFSGMVPAFSFLVFAFGSRAFSPIAQLVRAPH